MNIFNQRFENPLVPDGIEGPSKMDTRVIAHQKAIAAAKTKSIMDGPLSVRKKEIEEMNTNNKQKLINTFSHTEVPEEMRLYEQTYIDPMTGLFNRAALSGVDILIEQGKDVTIASFDADHFGLFNETPFDKAFGDYFIETVGAHFHDMIFRLRKEGHNVFALRMGGEEIVVAGVIPAERLMEAMEELKRSLQTDIWHNLNSEQMTALEENIFAKYDGTVSLEQAKSEIGGSTAGIVTTKTNRLKDVCNARQTLFEFTDAIVEHCKDPKNAKLIKNAKLGRNTIHGPKVIRKEGNTAPTVEELSPKQVQERILNFVPRNILSKEQNEKLAMIREIMDMQVEKQFLAYCPRFRILRKRIIESRDPMSKALIKQLKLLLQSPITETSERELFYLRSQLEITEAEFKLLKLEWMHAKKHVNSYTGAMSQRKIKELKKTDKPKQFSSDKIYTISIEGFRSINAAGHTHGDTILTLVYQEAILPALKEAAINPDQYITAQKGADFQCVFRNDVEQKTIERFDTFMKEFYIDILKDLDENLPLSQDHDRRENSRGDRRTSPGSFEYTGTLSERRLQWISRYPGQNKGVKDINNICLSRI